MDGGTRIKNNVRLCCLKWPWLCVTWHLPSGRLICADTAESRDQSMVIYTSHNLTLYKMLINTYEWAWLACSAHIEIAMYSTSPGCLCNQTRSICVGVVWSTESSNLTLLLLTFFFTRATKVLHCKLANSTNRHIIFITHWKVMPRQTEISVVPLRQWPNTWMPLLYCTRWGSVSRGKPVRLTSAVYTYDYYNKLRFFISTYKPWNLKVFGLIWVFSLSKFYVGFLSSGIPYE